MLLPGVGDLQEFVNDQLEKSSDCGADSFTLEMAQELLEELISWIADDEDTDDETHRSTT